MKGYKLEARSPDFNPKFMRFSRREFHGSREAVRIFTEYSLRHLVCAHMLCDYQKTKIRKIAKSVRLCVFAIEMCVIRREGRMECLGYIVSDTIGLMNYGDLERPW